MTHCKRLIFNTICHKLMRTHIGQSGFVDELWGYNRVVLNFCRELRFEKDLFFNLRLKI